MGFHAGLVSPKNTTELLDAIHLLSKRLMGQSSDLKKKINEFKKIKDDEQLKQKLLELKKIFDMEMREEGVVQRYGMQAEAIGFEDLRKEIITAKGLAQSYRIPSSHRDEIIKRVNESISKSFKGIKEQEVIDLIINREGKSFKVFSKKSLVRTMYGWARREKVNIFHAKKHWKKIEELLEKEKQDDILHKIDSVRDDFIKQAKEENKLIMFIHTSLIYGTIIMEGIMDDFQIIKEYIGKNSELLKIEKQLEGEWKAYMGQTTKISRQIRFSVVPHEIS